MEPFELSDEEKQAFRNELLHKQLQIELQISSLEIRLKQGKIRLNELGITLTEIGQKLSGFQEAMTGVAEGSRKFEDWLPTIHKLEYRQINSKKEVDKLVTTGILELPFALQTEKAKQAVLQKFLKEITVLPP